MKLILLAAMLWLIWYLFFRKPKPLSPRAQACALLGVATDAGADAIRAAHRARIAAVHPDRGGSADLTGRLNAARDLLLRREP